MAQSTEKQYSHNLGLATSMLDSQGIKYQSENAGSHIVIEGKSEIIDYYPLNGNFEGRITHRKGNGMMSLLKEIQDVV